MFSTRLLATVTRLSSHVFKRTTHSSFSQSQEKHVAELINDKIRGTKVMVFSKSYCPFCTKAKRVFEELIDDSKLSMEDYEVLEIEDDPRCDDIQAHLGELTGAKSVRCFCVELDVLLMKYNGWQ